MGFTHFDKNGNARMVDVSEKNETFRTASARGVITVSETVYTAVKDGRVVKGDVLAVATSAGIMGAKRTWELIPMCHLLPLSKCEVNWEMVAYPEKNKYEIVCTCSCSCTGKTGVEMEALTGVSTALLTVYDMCKSMDRSMEIGHIFLSEKKGGKSGHYERQI